MNGANSSGFIRQMRRLYEIIASPLWRSFFASIPMSVQNEKIDLAFIGGSGFYSLSELRNAQYLKINTPFGKPSAEIAVGEISSIRVAFIPRHGVNHELLPGEVPYAANIYALKSLNSERIISISAVGSLDQKIQPLDVVIPDQLIDLTKNRLNSYFGNGIVAHVNLSDPFCPDLRAQVLSNSFCNKPRVHDGGTCIVIEGPQFSTRAESRLYKNWGAHVIGMTAMPEARLAREAEICYSMIAMVTDYDSWKSDETDVTTDMVVNNLNKNSEVSKNIILKIANNLESSRNCKCGSSLEGSIITKSESESESVNKIQHILNKYVDRK